MFSFKVIKPKRPRGLDTTTINARFSSVVNAVVEGAAFDFRATVATWQHQPKFAVLKARKGGSLFQLGQTAGGGGTGDLVGAVSTDDSIYALLDKGSPAHAIVARNAPALSYQTQFVPKTTPGVLSSKSGGKFGAFNPEPKPQWVWHPGHAARKFEATVKARYGPILNTLAADMLSHIVRDSGWKI